MVNNFMSRLTEVRKKHNGTKKRQGRCKNDGGKNTRAAVFRVDVHVLHESGGRLYVYTGTD